MNCLAQEIYFSKLPLIPQQEVLCYESLWAEIKGVSFKNIEECLHGQLPSSYLSRLPEKTKKTVKAYLDTIGSHKYDVLLRETVDYPEKLKSLEIPLLYYIGNIGLVKSPCVSIVGSRKASPSGLVAAARIAEAMTQAGYTIVSGLAAGVDTSAHNAAMNSGGQTLGVIGTPINRAYPSGNRELQKKIGKEYLLLSHVPFYKYSTQDYRINRSFFPERNKVMAALSEATIIAEAGELAARLRKRVSASDFKKNSLFSNLLMTIKL
jgi:DNA processing protein